MSEKTEHDNETPLRWQKMFDNIWLLFVVSLAISTVIYNLWGIIDLMNVPLAP